MILYHDTIDMVPHHEHTTCPFHQRHPGKLFAGCTCSSTFGYRKATPEERRKNLERARKEIQEKIDDLIVDRNAIDRELE